MRTWTLLAVPVILLAGLAIGASKLNGLLNQEEICEVGTCPLNIREGDSGRTFLYGMTTRFGVLLDERRNPRGNLHCTPEGIIGSVSNIPAVEPPLYAARFEAVATGTCKLADDNFSVTIVIKD